MGRLCEVDPWLATRSSAESARSPEAEPLSSSSILYFRATPSAGLCPYEQVRAGSIPPPSTISVTILSNVGTLGSPPLRTATCLRGH